jgi:uncharacterized membrane protein YhaH (DUF805 family)
MYLVKLCFSFSGRVNRAKYWLGLAIALCIVILSMRLARFAYTTLEAKPALLIAGVLGFVYLLIVLATATKRLHDLDFSGWWAFGFLIAF